MADFVNAAFGIDHPLVTVRDLDRAADRLARLGFVVTPRGHHPWGTDNRLALFAGGLIELMTIGDAAAVRANDVDHGLFGTVIERFLETHEGVAMVALHSTDIERDEADATARGVPVTGDIDFRRPVRLPDGTDDVAVVKLAMLADRRHPTLSHFLCQQMKRSLVEVPAWRAHPNGATRLAGITYLDDEAGSAAARCRSVWGEPIRPNVWRSAGGLVEVVTEHDFADRFDGLRPTATMEARRPCVVAIATMVRDMGEAARIVHEATPTVRADAERIIVSPDYLADTIFEFVPA